MSNQSEPLRTGQRAEIQFAPIPRVERRRFERRSVDQPAEVRILNPTISERREARVLEVSREGLRLRLSESLLPGANLQARLADSIVFGEVRYCRRVGSSFEVGILVQDRFPAPSRETPVPKRKNPRSLVNVEGVLRLGNSSDAVFRITVLDVSRVGLRIRCSAGFSAGTLVEVTCRGATIAGTVRYSREVEPNAFNLGINTDRISEGGGFEHCKELDIIRLFGLV